MEKEVSNQSALKTSWQLFNLCRKIAFKEVMLVSIISLIIGSISFMMLLSVENLVDAISLNVVEEGKDYTKIITWLIVFIIVIVLSKVLTVFGRVINSHLQEKLKEKCKQHILEKAYSLSLADFDNPKLYDSLVRVNRGMDQRLFSTMAFMVQMMNQFVSLISILIYLLFINWFIPLILLVGTIIFTLFQVKVFKERYILEKEQTTASRKLNYLTTLMTTRMPAKELRLYGLERYFQKEWNELNASLINERMNLVKKEAKTEAVGLNGHSFTFFFILILILQLIKGGLLTIGQYAAFIRAVISFQKDMSDFLYNLAIIKNDLRYIQDFFFYLNLPDEKREGTLLQNDRAQRRTIRLEEVGFTYPETRKEVLREISFDIKPGEKIAILGNNGSGKSTLIKLLLGLYKPTKGNVYIDEMNIKEIDLNDWWTKATAIFQDFQKYQLLNVRENIGVGNLSQMESLKKVQQSAVLAGADEMIQTFPDQYETMLGKEFGGEELSQGQWQKIAVARAYIKDAELLILDEPTASLDPRAEMEIFSQFEQVSEGKTVVFISHRLGVARLADRIIFLQDGKISEQGTHEQLVKDNGHYAEMYHKQAQWYK